MLCLYLNTDEKVTFATMGLCVSINIRCLYIISTQKCEMIITIKKLVKELPRLCNLYLYNYLRILLENFYHRLLWEYLEQKFIATY